MKLDIKIKWNKFLSDEIEKKINNWLKNKKNSNKEIKTKFDIKIKWNKMLMDEIEKKNQSKKALKAKQIIIKRMMTKIDMNTNWFLEGLMQNPMLGEKNEGKWKTKSIKTQSLFRCSLVLDHQRMTWYFQLHY